MFVKWLVSLNQLSLFLTFDFPLSEQTEGCSGAELIALCQDAALLTMKNDFEAPFVSSSS